MQNPFITIKDENSNDIRINILRIEIYYPKGLNFKSGNFIKFINEDEAKKIDQKIADFYKDE